MSRLEALRTFEAHLRLMKAQFDEATAAGVQDWQKRMLAHQSLMASIELVEQIAADAGGLNRGYVMLLEAVTDGEKGRDVDWLRNSSAGRPSVRERVILLRARYAAVMEFLMRHGHQRKEAADIVLRSIPKQTQGKLGAKTWLSIAEWRNSITGFVEPEREQEREGFETMMAQLTAMHGEAKERARSMLNAIAKAASL